MGYEEAPSTKMLFQHCLVCGRPLRDAVSVESGVGPKCRERIGMVVDGELSPERQACNKLIHEASVCVLENRPSDLFEIIRQIHQLSFSKVAEVISERFVPITITEVDHAIFGLSYAVKVPFKENFGYCLRQACSGVNWVKEDRLYYISRTPQNKMAIWRCLLSHFTGQPGYSKTGLFKVENVKAS